MDLGYSGVVRTTKAMVIHSAGGAFRERQEKTTERKIVLTSMRVLVLGQLQRPVAARCRVVGLQSHNVACGRGDGAARVGIFRVRTSVFHRNRRRT